MESFIVTGAVVVFMLLLIPAVVVPFLPRNPSRLDTIVRRDAASGQNAASGAVRPVADPSERIAA